MDSDKLLMLSHHSMKDTHFFEIDIQILKLWLVLCEIFALRIFGERQREISIDSISIAQIRRV